MSIDELSENSMYTPVCDIELKPHLHQRFHTEEDGVNFYKEYAKACGFDVRLGQRKTSYNGLGIILRYVFCNRPGHKFTRSEGKKRRTLRTSCPARLDLKFDVRGGYFVNRFVEYHNHPLLSEESRNFQKSSRSMYFVHQKFVLDCARSCIGPMKSFRLFKEMMGSFPTVGCSLTDFKNYSHDRKSFVEGVDAQMVINMLSNKKRNCVAFSFEYYIDGEEKLSRVFWADPICKRNYSIFGDIVSFDATYSTNSVVGLKLLITSSFVKYNMIFAPLTGNDNHVRCITFGACLITNEDAESYSWDLEKFKLCMGRNPSVIVTDQDLGMKVFIEHVLEGTRHRNCMWHIMLKVPDKVPSELKKNNEFMKTLCKIVWTEEIEPTDFEMEWNTIMEEYGLGGNPWFDNMFQCRKFWIPAYFRDTQYNGLIKTTSISGSENHAFQAYLKPRFNLLEFFMNYESEIDSQRYSASNLNYLDEVSRHKMQTTLGIEKHVASIYTYKMFKFVQKEIMSACFDCRIQGFGVVGPDIEYRVIDDFEDLRTVTHNPVVHTTICSCKLFVRIGVLCCHIFYVLKNLKVDKIPEKYIVHRWRKNAHLKSINPISGGSYGSFAVHDQSKINLCQLISECYNCIGLVDEKCDLQEELLSDVIALKEKYKREGSSNAKAKNFEQFYGATVPTEINIKPPDPVKTKGSGRSLVSRKEKVARVANRPLRKCSVCKKLGHHDKRTYGKASGKKTAAKVSTIQEYDI